MKDKKLTNMELFAEYNWMTMIEERIIKEQRQLWRTLCWERIAERYGDYKRLHDFLSTPTNQWGTSCEDLLRRVQSVYNNNIQEQWRRIENLVFNKSIYGYNPN